MATTLPRVALRRARPDDWPRMSAIYAAGIATGNATFETEVPAWEDWDASHLPGHRFVAVERERVVGWVALTGYSDRCCYDGVADLSVYVDPSAQGRPRVWWSRSAFASAPRRSRPPPSFQAAVTRA